MSTDKISNNLNMNSRIDAGHEGKKDHTIVLAHGDGGIKTGELVGKIIRISITKTPTRKFYLNVLVENEIEKLPLNKNAVAIDVGLLTFAKFSNGKEIKNLRFYKNREKKS